MNETTLKNPLAYCPPNYLGAKNQEVDVLVAFSGLITDQRIWQMDVEQVDDTVTLTYRSLIENLYKESQVVLPNGVIAPLPKLYQVFASVSTKPKGRHQEPTYTFKLWTVDPAGCIHEQYELPLLGALSLLYPTATKFKLRMVRYLEVDGGGFEHLIKL